MNIQCELSNETMIKLKAGDKQAKQNKNRHILIIIIFEYIIIVPSSIMTHELLKKSTLECGTRESTLRLPYEQSTLKLARVDSTVV